MFEEERKYEVDPGFTLPELGGALPAGGQVVPCAPVSLRATYYDTADLRLARAGASLRYRRGDEEPWTVKLPTDVPGIRHEISRAGPPGTIPAELVGVVTSYARGAALSPATVLRTTRRVYELRGRDGGLLAEVDDDTVAVMEGKSVRSRFREIEVERHTGGRKLLDRVGDELRAAGAATGTFTPKHVRALGGVGPDDLVRPCGTLSRKASAGEVVTEALRADVARMLSHDPLVRLRIALPDGDTAVHQMRVGCRRLRSDLRTFRPLLDQAWVGRLRDELAWMADVLGAVRDAEVLRARLRRTAGSDPLAPLDDAAVARIDTELAARQEEALTALDAQMRTERYVALLDMLVAAAATPRLASADRAPLRQATRLASADRAPLRQATRLAAVRATQPARDLLPRLVAKPWRQLAYGVDGVTGAGSLDPTAPDDDWHQVRIRAKRARYAAEAVAGLLGGPAAELARAVAAVQNLLGEHQDAVIAADTWLSIAQSDPDDHTLAVTAGRLVERERASVRQVRADFPDAWAAADRRRLTDWLP
jgi:CHAD domain-containing protein